MFMTILRAHVWCLLLAGDDVTASRQLAASPDRGGERPVVEQSARVAQQLRPARETPQPRRPHQARCVSVVLKQCCLFYNT